MGRNRVALSVDRGYISYLRAFACVLRLSDLLDDCHHLILLVLISRSRVNHWHVDLLIRRRISDEADVGYLFGVERTSVGIAWLAGRSLDGWCSSSCAVQRAATVFCAWDLAKV